MNEPTTEQRAEYDAWAAERPYGVREVAQRLFPWRTYRLKETGQLLRITSYQEPSPPEYPEVTLNVFAWREWSGPALGHGVFGIDPDSLEEIDEQGENEA